MFLKALEIQGFKSFPDRTRVEFDKGITAVVGPNGSGKSNISDAVRWVLGETSIKQLRGGGKMENVIFGGTQKRNAMGFASVKLVLDNTSRRLDVEANEVIIGRKYFRSSESEYSINGQSVRLRDVYELLLDTGLGRDGYSIIGQGRIAEIVGAKSADRREIFEEASGIARYRYRKNEAQRRLASTEDNLVRLRDILGELEARVGPLEKDSKKAEKFLEFSAQRKSLEVTLWVDTISSTREGLRGQQRKIEISEADYAIKGEEADALYESTKETRHQIEQFIMQIEKAGNNILALQEELSGKDSQLAVLDNEIHRNKESIAELQGEINQGGEAEEEISAQTQQHNSEIVFLRQKLQEGKINIQNLEQQLVDMQAKSLSTGERRGELEAKLTSIAGDVTLLRVGEAGAKSSIESFESRMQDEQAEAARYGEEIAEHTQQKEETEVFLAQTNDTLEKLANIKGGLEMKLAAKNKTLADAEEAQRRLVSGAEAAQQRITVLKELENSLDGYQFSVKNVVKAGRNGQLRGIIGPVSSILSVKAGYEVAIETALGYSLQNIVVADEAAAKAAMAFLKKSNGGRATFLPMDTVRAQRLETALPNTAQSAQNLVDYNAQYENIVSSLLARIVVVQDINTASNTAKTLGYRNRVVTQDGQVINAGGSFTGGSVSRSVGIFSRKQEIEDLTAKVALTKEQHTEVAKQAASIKAEVDALFAELTATNSEAITFGGDKIRCETELARMQQTINNTQRNLQNMLQECELLKTKTEKAKEDVLTAQSQQKQLEEQSENLAAELAGISGDDNSFLDLREDLSTKLSDYRISVLTLEHDVDTHLQKIETLQSRTGEGAARRDMLHANIARFEAQNSENRAHATNVSVQTENIKNKIKDINDEIADMRAKRIEKEGQITGQTAKERAITAEREELGREIARLQEQKKAMEERFDGTISKLWEEYELTLADAEAMCVEFSSALDLRRQVNELRAKIKALGNINVGAIEEFKEVNERYIFLGAQVGDVEKSKTELEKMIAELSAEMTTIFAQSFVEINNNFGRIFAELFGGGEASLTLSDPENMLDSGIDIEVSPPGKIIKDLSALSGGEQALVAICIYFAILGVNPSPFCVLDEIEAALDDANVVRFAQYLRRITKRTQFIVITHRRGTMEEADVLYGVTMQEDGVSNLLRLSVEDVDVTLVR